MGFFMEPKNIGIDLGTSNTLLFLKGKGVILNEPSVVAINTKNNKIYAVGSDAKKMIGRTSEDIVTVRPLKDGVIANLDITQQMLRMLIEKASGKTSFKNFSTVICHPSEVTEVEKRVINDVTSQVGVRKVMLVEEPIAAAIGAGLPVSEPVGNMIIDIGGGTTEVSVISLGGIVKTKSLKVAGNTLDEAIVNYIKKEFNLFIGENTAENIKIGLGSVHQDDNGEDRQMQISGRDLITGLPRVIVITENRIREVMKEPVALIIEAIKSTLEETEPELVADIMDKGIMLSGGGALIKGLDKLIYKQVNIPTFIAENPLECVVLGAGQCLDMVGKI